MRRRAAECSEVAGVLSQTASEVRLPDAVDNHARRQRVVRLSQPFGQCRTAPGCFLMRSDGRNFGIGRIEDAQNPRRDLRLSFRDDRHRRVGRNIRDDQRGRKRLRPERVMLQQFPTQSQ